jgi:hypothetical protein
MNLIMVATWTFLAGSAAEDGYGRPLIDEIVLRNAFVHIEMMNQSSAFVALIDKHGIEHRLWLHATRSGGLQIVPEEVPSTV